MGAVFTGAGSISSRIYERFNICIKGRDDEAYEIEAVTYLCWSSSRGFITSGLSLEFGPSGGASLGCSVRDVNEGAWGLLASGWAGGGEENRLESEREKSSQYIWSATVKQWGGGGLKSYLKAN